MPDSPISSLATIDRENPWPGLASFTEDARGFFFGRERETDELSRLVRRQTLTVLFGQSGLGKSSLIQAGLFPLLREQDFLPLYLRLDHNPNSPVLAEQVKAALVAAFQREKADAPAPRADETLWEYFHRKDIDIWSAKNRLLTPVLAFDQFEEIFTLGRTGEAARDRSRAFLVELACLIENRAPPAVQEKLDRGDLDPTRFNHDKPSCQVILSLREDFLPDLEGLKQEMPALIHNRLRLKKLSGTQALEIVTKPAPQLIADGVAEKIVEFVAGARGGSAERLAELDVEPPLLSVICRELNDRRRSLGQAQITADLVSGNRREILHDFYERSVADLPEPMRAFVEDHLLTKSGFRDNLALETALEFPGVTRPLIDTLVSRRLLRLEDRLGVQRVELTHDVLADVVHTSRDTRQQRHAAAEAARRTRRMRFAIAGLAAAVAALGVGAIFGLRAQKLAAQRGSRTDVLYASRLLEEGKVADGLAYLVRAARKDPENNVLAPRLLTALVSHNFFLPQSAPLQLPSRAAFARCSPDGSEIYVECEDRVIRVIDVQTWQLARELRFPARLIPRRWTLPDDNTSVLVVALENKALLICDPKTGQPKFPPLVSPDKPAEGWGQFGLTANGRWLVATKFQTANWVWDTETGQLRTTLPDLDGFSISADSKHLVGRITGKAISRVFTLPEGTPVGKEFRDGSDNVRGGFIAPDGSRVMAMMVRSANIAGSVAVILQAYDTATGEATGPAVDIGINIQGVALSPDARLLAVTRLDRTATLFDLGTGKPALPPFRHGGPVYDPAFSRDGKVLFTNCVDGLVRLWDTETGKPLAESTFKQEGYTPAVATPDGRGVAVFTAKGAYHLRVGRGPAEPLVLPRGEPVAMTTFLVKPPLRQLWLMRDRAKAIEVTTGREVEGGFSYPAPIIPGIGGLGFRNGQFADEGTHFLVKTTRNSHHAWPLGPNGIAQPIPLADFPGNINPPQTSPSGFLVAAALRNEGKNALGVWDLRSGQRIHKFDTPGAPSRMVFDQDEKRIAYVAGGRDVRVSELATGRELFTLPSPERANLVFFRFNIDGKRIISGDDWGGLQFWDGQTGKLIRSVLPHRDRINSLDFSPDGRYFMSSSWDGTAQVWDLATSEPVGAPIVHAQRILGAVFSPDSTRLLSASDDGTTRIWDARTGQPLTEPMRHPTGVQNVSFSPDGRYVSTRTPEAFGAPANRLWSFPREAGTTPTPKWLLQMATVCASQRVNDEGDVVPAADDLVKIADIRRELAALPDDAPYVEWGRWFLSDSPTRSIAPGFKITPAEAKKLSAEFLRIATQAGASAGN